MSFISVLPDRMVVKEPPLIRALMHASCLVGRDDNQVTLSVLFIKVVLQIGAQFFYIGVDHRRVVRLIATGEGASEKNFS